MKKVIYLFMLFIALLFTSCADAGKEQTVNAGETVTLDGKNSLADVYGEIKKYNWKQVKGTKVKLTDKNSVQATFVAPTVTKKIKLVFRLKTVEKGGYISPWRSKDRVTVFVNPATVNKAPTAMATVTQATINEGESVTFDGSQSTDSDGQIVSYAWSFENNATLLSQNSQFEHIFEKAGTYTIKLTVTDNDGAVGTMTQTVNVVAKIILETLESNQAKELNVGESIALVVKQGDNDITNSVTWEITPQELAEMNGTKLVALKDGNVSLKAIFNGAKSNALSFNIIWEINGHTLPPEPDEAENNATLGGVDSNGNGVRDDVERKIRQKYPKPLQSAILMYDAKFYQRTLIESTENAIEIQKDATRTIDCTMYLMKFDSEIEKISWMENSKYIKDLTFNNLERIEKYWKYNIALSGGSYGSSFEDENIDACSQEVADVLEGMK